jgi:hypothetical protein
VQQKYQQIAHNVIFGNFSEGRIFRYLFVECGLNETCSEYILMIDFFCNEFLRSVRNNGFHDQLSTNYKLYKKVRTVKAVIYFVISVILLRKYTEKYVLII